MLRETTMAFPYDTPNDYTANDLNASAPAPVLFTQEPDDFSVFLQQILFGAPPTPSRNAEPVDEELYPGRISGPVVNQSGLPLNVSSSPVGTFENDTDEYDGESEEGVEALVGEPAEKQTQKKNSKRSRAAEVHNLSEKRRRSKINEKMKALQKLIPNSNKTDKASMLDEAIEYLKQLQLQVQMLTLRNGLSLYPVCLPEMLEPDQVPQMTLDMFESNKTVNMSLAKPVPANQNLPADNLVSFQEKPVAAFPTGVGSRAESSTQNRFAPFQLQGIGREEVHPRQHFMEGYPGAGMTALTMMAGNGVVTSNAKAA